MTVVGNSPFGLSLVEAPPWQTVFTQLHDIPAVAIVSTRSAIAHPMFLELFYPSRKVSCTQYDKWINIDQDRLLPEINNHLICRNLPKELANISHCTHRMQRQYKDKGISPVDRILVKAEVHARTRCGPNPSATD